jgi:DNA-binding NtrC family response regulator
VVKEQNPWSFEWSLRSEVLEQVQEKCPSLPVIIFCRMGSEKEWVEVLEAGGFDLLVPPYRKSTVLSVLEHAVASYEARRAEWISRTDVPRADAARGRNQVRGDWLVAKMWQDRHLPLRQGDQ